MGRDRHLIPTGRPRRALHSPPRNCRWQSVVGHRPISMTAPCFQRRNRTGSSAAFGESLAYAPTPAKAVSLLNKNWDKVSMIFLRFLRCKPTSFKNFR